MLSYRKALDQRKQEHLLRMLPLPPTGADFYSNDYLGLAKSTELETRIQEESDPMLTASNGATGSRLLSGNSNYSEKVEQQVASFHNSDAALIYCSGYNANLGLISSLATKDTTLIMDQLIHASLIDGARLGVSKKVRFAHNNPEDLKQKLANIQGQKIVVVESIYSMDGDICPLKEIVSVCEKFEAQLIVDEAHSFGVMGKQGEGLCQKLGLEHNVLGRIVTYGKGAGIHGAAVVGPKWLKEYQVNFSRPFIFSTAPTPHQFKSISSMYNLMHELSEPREQLQQVINYFVQKRKTSNAKWLPSTTQIQSLIIPGNAKVIAKAEELQAEGIIALPIRKPSVASGQERIRFCLHSFNTKDQIDQLFELL